jgi:hypothetical protein
MNQNNLAMRWRERRGITTMTFFSLLFSSERAPSSAPSLSRHHSARSTDPLASVLEDTRPGTASLPLLRLLPREPTVAHELGDTLRVRHEREDTPVERLNTGDTILRPVGAVRVSARRLARRVDEADNDLVTNAGLSGGRDEGRATLTVSDGDGEDGTAHTAKEDGAGGFRRVDDFDEGGATLEATGKVLSRATEAAGDNDGGAEKREGWVREEEGGRRTGKEERRSK